MNSRQAREEHDAELSTRPERGVWNLARKVQSSISNGFIHRWAARRIPAGELVLDAACGDGRLARVRSGPYLGFDFVERLARRAQCWSFVPVGVADILAMPVRTESVGIVTCFEVLEHLGDPRAAVLEFARVLRPGGKLLLSVPNDAGLKHRLKRDPHPLHHGEMTASRLRDIVDGPLQVEDVHFRGIWLFTPGRVSVQIGARANERLATNILLVATKGV